MEFNCRVSHIYSLGRKDLFLFHLPHELDFLPPIYVSNQYLSLCHSHILITFCETHQPLREMKHQATSHAVSFSPPTHARSLRVSTHSQATKQAAIIQDADTLDADTGT